MEETKEEQRGMARGMLVGVALAIIYIVPVILVPSAIDKYSTGWDGSLALIVFGVAYWLFISRTMRIVARKLMEWSKKVKWVKRFDEK